MKCQYCEKSLKNKNSLTQHEIRCNKNSNKINTVCKWSEKQKLNWSKKCLETGVNNKEWTKERRDKISLASKKNNLNYWTEEKRLEHSKRMREVVLKKADSYTKNNVSGRVKTYEVMSSFGPTKVKGQWELQVANWLNENNIKWTNNIEPYNYFWNDKWHLYFPDFLLLDEDILIEVKGYETDRDHKKWNSVKDKKFFVLKEDEIEELSRSMEEVIRSVS